MADAGDIANIAVPLIGLGIGLAVLDSVASNLNKKKKRRGKNVFHVNRALFG